MPLTKKGSKIKKAMSKTYGPKEGEKVFYASKNKGTIDGVDKKTKLAKTAKAKMAKVKRTKVKSL